MKNSFNVEVNFDTCPLMPYEWEKSEEILHIKLDKISTSTLKNILLYNGKIVSPKNSKIMLLSDAREAIAIKLDKDGNVLKRSFLSFDKSLEVSEFANNLKPSDIEFISNKKKIEYPKTLSIETEVKNYILEAIKKSKDEYFTRYLYYLYYEDLEGYTKERLLKTVDSSPIDKNIKLYQFLIGS